MSPMCFFVYSNHASWLLGPGTMTNNGMHKPGWPPKSFLHVLGGYSHRYFEELYFELCPATFTSEFCFDSCVPGIHTTPQGHISVQFDYFDARTLGGVCASGGKSILFESRFVALVWIDLSARNAAKWRQWSLEVGCGDCHMKWEADGLLTHA